VLYRDGAPHLVSGVAEMEESEGESMVMLKYLKNVSGVLDNTGRGMSRRCGWVVEVGARRECSTQSCWADSKAEGKAGRGVDQLSLDFEAKDCQDGASRRRTGVRTGSTTMQEAIKDPTWRATVPNMTLQETIP